MSGFTNEQSLFDKTVKFRKDAIDDGWIAKPLYPNHESIDRTTELSKDGFKMFVITRQNEGGKTFKFEAQVTIWAPDGLVVKTPGNYSWDDIKNAVNHCHCCNKSNVKTFRYSFAGRCCSNCLPEMQRKHEKPGWNS